MDLVVDIGNTSVKAALFENNGIHKVLRADDAFDDLSLKLKSYDIERMIVSSTRDNVQEVGAFWSDRFPVIVQDHMLPLPIQIAYKTPETLGKDRVAACVGARFLHPQGPLLSIDIGTCITYDILTADDEYLGGSISPGIELRYRAMHEFTAALPLVDHREVNHPYGYDTTTSLSTGVILGITEEIEGRISRYEAIFPELKTILTGGDARYFVNHVKKKIFANQNLVLIGLHKILKYNS